MQFCDSLKEGRMIYRTFEIFHPWGGGFSSIGIDMLVAVFLLGFQRI
jgi:hypothetical protein